MKKLVFTVISIIFLLFVAACTKQDLFENKAELKTKVETLSSNQSKPDLSALQRKAYNPNFKLLYIGDEQWQGRWNGTELIFHGPADYQLNDGLLHRYELVSAMDGSNRCGYSQVGDDNWSITQFLAMMGEVKVQKVDWIEKITGYYFVGYIELCPGNGTFNGNILTTANYKQTVTYFPTSYDFGNGKFNTFSISIVEVDGYPEIFSKNPKATSPVDPLR